MGLDDTRIQEFLAAKEVACGPVVHEREAADGAVGPDHGRDLELVVELVGALWVGDLVLRAEDRGRVREVEGEVVAPERREVAADRGILFLFLPVVP